MKNVIYILLLLFIVSCDDAFFNEGDIITKNIKTTDYTEILVQDIFDINLIQDTVCKIEVKAGSNIIQNLSFKIDGDQLTIDDNNTAAWSRQYNRTPLNLHFKELTKVTMKESSSLNSADTIFCQDILIHALAEYTDIDVILKSTKFHFANSESSGGSYIFKGKTSNFRAWVRGSGIFKAENFIANEIYFRSQSMGNCYVHSISKLTVKFENSGLIYYKGDPVVEIETPEFSNQLIKMN